MSMKIDKRDAMHYPFSGHISIFSYDALQRLCYQILVYAQFVFISSLEIDIAASKL